jgi:hypothetical protein
VGAGTGFLWDGGRTDAALDSLAAGIYSVTVTNPFGCTTSATASLSEPMALVLSLTAQPSTGNDGSAAAAVSGGTPPYVLLWDTGAQTDSLQQLAPGLYALTVTDANGCAIFDSVRVDSLPVTGLPESPQNLSEAWIFPNPGTGALTLRTAHWTAERAVLYDLQGRSLGAWRWPAAAPDLSLDLSHLPAGVYCWALLGTDGRTKSLVWEKR